MFVGVNDDGVVDMRYGDEKVELLMKHVTDAVLHKVQDEIGENGRGISISIRWWKGHSFSKMIRVIS